jgi:DNA-binding transcriptional LysR family regulator
MWQHPRISLEQWRALVAVVDEGGYAQAASALNKSQSAVTYAVQKIETLLDVKALEITGRKAGLTPTGQLLYRRARLLLEDAGGLERAAQTLAAGWEAEIGIAVDVVFPVWLLLKCLDAFSTEAPHTSIEVIESVLGGGPEALSDGRAQLAIGPARPGLASESLMRLRFVPAAHPDHALHRLGRPLTEEDLRAHRHLVVRDTSSRRDASTRLEARQRWTVSNMTTSIGAACRGYGFAWFPEEKIRSELEDGTLAVLPMRDGGDVFVDLSLVLADPDAAGPGTLRLAQLLREIVSSECALRRNSPDSGS